MMARSPPIAPHTPADRDTYLVLDDLGGRLGRVWCETDEDEADRAALIWRLLDGQYTHPARIVAFSTEQGWSRDVTSEIADELRRRFVELDEVQPSVLEFLDRVARRR